MPVHRALVTVFTCLFNSRLSEVNKGVHDDGQPKGLTQQIQHGQNVPGDLSALTTIAGWQFDEGEDHEGVESCLQPNVRQGMR
eukprot:Skav201716  [mRNA]  locus=scaffold311:286337:289042:+ [translate_table: standard]